MEYKIYKEDDFRVSNWMGGKTTQLAIFPETAKYLERNFIWRLSSATCEKEESDFSKLAEFDRVLMVLQGDVVLAHQDVRVARLGELEQDSFDGGYSTKSFGKITDYNLILAKEMCIRDRGMFAPINFVYQSTIEAGSTIEVMKWLAIWAVPGALIQLIGGNHQDVYKRQAGRGNGRLKFPLTGSSWRIICL